MILDKLNFYFPGEMTEEGEIPDRHEPLSKWSKFFLCVGLYLAEKKESNGPLDSLVISTPCRDFASSLITFGFIKGVSNYFENIELDEHYRKLTELQKGTPLLFKDGNKNKPGSFESFDAKTGAIKIKTVASGTMYRSFYKTSCGTIQISNERFALPYSSEGKGQRVVKHSAFLAAILGKNDCDNYLSNLETQVVILGSKNLLIEEMTKENFSYGPKKIIGCLDDLIRIRSGKIKGSNFGAFIIPQDGAGSERFSKFPYLQKAPYAIFDSSKSFLAWRRYWLESNWIVLLSRFESSYKEAVIEVNGNVARNVRSKTMDEIAQLGIPSGIELISFSRTR